MRRMPRSVRFLVAGAVTAIPAIALVLSGTASNHGAAAPMTLMSSQSPASPAWTVGTWNGRGIVLTIHSNGSAVLDSTVPLRACPLTDSPTSSTCHVLSTLRVTVVGNVATLRVVSGYAVDEFRTCIEQGAVAVHSHDVFLLVRHSGGAVLSKSRHLTKSPGKPGLPYCA